MAQQLLHLGSRGFAHTRDVLAEYLPGLSPGLIALSERRALMPASTWRALRREYGAAPALGVLRKAGVLRRLDVTDADALALVGQRKTSALPARLALPAAAQRWHLDEVQAPAAWSHWGRPSTIDWTGIKLGQIDTGYTNHPVFGFPGTSWIDTQAGRTMFAVGAGPGGAGPGGGIDPLEDQMDGHGTRVASVLCGHDLQAPGGAYFGIAPRVPLIPVRIANHVFISHAQRELAQALDYLVQQGASVINLSMGFLPRLVMSELKRAIDRTYEAGVIFVCAAGQPLASVVSPAHGRRSIAAAGSTIGSIPWSQSAHGGAVDWSAPAEHIHRAEANAGGAAQYAGGGDGTSYATAITSGAAALWLARHRDAIAAAYAQGWQRVEAVKVVAKASAKPMPNQQPGSFGAGVLNIAALLQQALPPASGLQREGSV